MNRALKKVITTAISLITAALVAVPVFADNTVCNHEYEETYETIHHEAVTHEEDQGYYTDGDLLEEARVDIEYYWVYMCKQCGYQTDSVTLANETELTEEIVNHLFDNYGCNNYTLKKLSNETFYEAVYEQVWVENIVTVVDEEAYDEEVLSCYTCSHCGDTLSIEEHAEYLESLNNGDNTDQDTDQDATQDDQGNTQEGDTANDESGTDDQDVTCKEHTWDGGVTKAATCTTNGSTTYTCTSCGETKTAAITATGHTWNSGKITTAATCTTKGVKTYTCTSCGQTKTSSIAATGHTSVSVSKKKATTSSNGYTAGTKCSTCGTKLSGQSTIYKIKSATLSTTSYTYNGKAKKPSVTVLDSKGNKISSDYYTVKYSNNKKVGTATVTITFKGNYSGTITKTFKINPKSTTIKSLSKGSKSFTVKWSKKTEEVTGYQIQYSTSSKFSSSKTTTVTVKKNSTTSKTIKSLKSGKKYYVRVRTYKTVNGKKYYSGWTTVKSIKTK